MDKLIKDENFYTVLGWMLNVLKLKGNELIIFAIIYGFTQDNESEFGGSVRYLQSFANIKSHHTVIGILKKLTNDQKIVRREFELNGVQRTAYVVNYEKIGDINFRRDEESKMTASTTKVNNSNFYTVMGWMLNALKLKGNDLIIFAIIYNHSQDNESEFKGSLKYLENFSNLNRKTVLSSLANLYERNLILRREYKNGNVQRVAYRTNFEEIEKLKTAERAAEAET